MKYQKLLSLLCNIEYQAEKTWLVREMATREQNRYEKLHQEIGKMVISHTVVSSSLLY